MKGEKPIQLRKVRRLYALQQTRQVPAATGVGEGDGVVGGVGGGLPTAASGVAAGEGEDAGGGVWASWVMSVDWSTIC